MFVKDATFLARLVRGQLTSGDVEAALTELSPQFEPLARRLANAVTHERQKLWGEFLAAHLPSDSRNGRAASPEAGARLIDPPPMLPLAHGATASEATGRRVRLTCASDLKPREVDWLWSGRVPLGMLTMFAGDPKLGKSYVTLAMSAALSRGVPLPSSDQPDRPGSTILMSAEDDPARTIVPRLLAAGADLTKIHILESVVMANGSEALPSLRADIDAITAAAVRLGDCRLIVIDPVSAYLNGVDDNRNAALRGVLSPLNRLAERLRAAVVLVSHLTKARSSNGKHRVLGSIAYVGACRANYLFVADPDDGTCRRVLMLDNGSNVAAPAPALAYTIENRDDGPRIEWADGPVKCSLIDTFQPARAALLGRPERAGPHQECDHWLCEFLANGPRSPFEIFQAAAASGFTTKQIRRAKDRIGARAVKQGFAATGEWLWRLDSDPIIG